MWQNDDKAVPNFYDNFVNCLPILKIQSANLEHCFTQFTASITQHIVTVIVQNAFLWRPVSMREDAQSMLSTALCSRPTNAASVSQRRELVTGTRGAGQGSK